REDINVDFEPPNVGKDFNLAAKFLREPLMLKPLPEPSVLFGNHKSTFISRTQATTSPFCL
ncbi:hypothetical protein SO802_011127, partial [Lithocarpus litseifolius]